MRGDDGRVVTNFILQALQGQALTVYGTGAQTRSFCYVDDLIEGFIRVLGLSSNPGPINLGNPNEFTMIQLAERVQELIRSKLPIVFNTLPVDDPKQRCPDISKAKKHLNGWEPKVQLREGLEKSISYFKKSSEK
jgi:UDP-glucuronate decarboxylase